MKQAVLLVTSFLILACSTGLAETFSGTYQKSANLNFIRLHSGANHLLKPGTALISKDFEKLSPGDLLVVYGMLKENEILVRSIERVGLQSLLGYWGTTDFPLKSYSFDNFQQLIIHNDPFFTQFFHSSASFNYYVTPWFGDQWNIHMTSEGMQNYSGKFAIHPKHLEIRFEEPRTGKVIYRAKLKKLSH